MPATAVGNANGRSTSESTNFRPGNVYRTNTHATRSPNTRLMSAAISDAPKVIRYDATARGSEITCQKRGHVMDAAFRNVAESGISTIRHKYETVNPRVIPN